MKIIIILLSALALTGCVVVPVVPNSVGVDIQPNVVYQQPIYQSTPIVINRYPRSVYRNNYYVNPRPIHRPRPHYKHRPHHNNWNRPQPKPYPRVYQ